MGIGFAVPGLRTIDEAEEFHLELFSYEVHSERHVEPVTSLHWPETRK